MFASLDVLQAASREDWAGIKHLISEKCSGTEEERKRRCKDRHSTMQALLLWFGFFCSRTSYQKGAGMSY